MALPETSFKITKKIRYVTIGFILLFALSAVGNIILQRKTSNLTREKNNQFLIAEKQTSERLSTLKELDATLLELNTLHAMNVDLTSSLREKNDQLKRTESQIRKFNVERTARTGAKDELKSLGIEKESLLKQVAELERQLKWKNEMLADLQKQADKLPDDFHERLDKAKLIRAVNISIAPSKSRSQYSVIPTLRAKKIKSITIDFDLLENLFAEAGNKTITAVLKSQNESSASLNTNFLQNGSNMEVTYNESDIHVKMSIEIKGSLTKGTYVLQLNVDRMPAGSKMINLK